MSYITYKLIHFAGIFMLIAALAATSMNAMRGGPRTEYAWRRALGAAHGVAVFLILLGGFGMLARLGIMRAEDGFPGWVLAKMAIWFVLGAAIVLPRFGRGFARALLVAAPVLAAGAGAIALLKPF